MGINFFRSIRSVFGAVADTATGISEGVSGVATYAKTYNIEAKADHKISIETLGRTYAQRRKNAIGNALSELKDEYDSFDPTIKTMVEEATKDAFDTKAFLKSLED